MTDLFSKSLEELARDVENMEESVKLNEECFPMHYIAYALAPIIIWVLLSYFKPGFVSHKKTNGEMELDKKKALMWTVVLTLVVYGGIYMMCKKQTT